MFENKKAANINGKHDNLWSHKILFPFTEIILESYEF